MSSVRYELKLYILLNMFVFKWLNFLYSVLKLQTLVHDRDTVVVYCTTVSLNKGNHYGRHLCHLCSANHGWLRELNAAAHALVGRTRQG